MQPFFFKKKSSPKKTKCCLNGVSFHSICIRFGVSPFFGTILSQLKMCTGKNHRSLQTCKRPSPPFFAFRACFPFSHFQSKLEKRAAFGCFLCQSIGNLQQRNGKGGRRVRKENKNVCFTL